MTAIVKGGTFIWRWFVVLFVVLVEDAGAAVLLFVLAVLSYA